MISFAKNVMNTVDTLERTGQRVNINRKAVNVRVDVARIFELPEKRLHIGPSITWGTQMRHVTRVLVLAMALVTATIHLGPCYAAEDSKTHRISIQVDQNDPAIMNLVLNNVTNLMEYYHGRGEQVQIEVVAYGPGLVMLREDKSPVKDRLKRLKEGSFPSSVKFSACGNTKENMEKIEGHTVSIVPQATIVPSGVARLTELQERGWTYIRP